MKKYRFIVYSMHGNYIIDMQENLTASEADDLANWFIENGYYQMANYRIEIM
jgi:hypothetical protein